MKKIKKLLSLTLVITSISLNSCSFVFGMLDHSQVEPFGNVSFADKELYGCIDHLDVNGEIYYYVSSLDKDLTYKEAIGAFNDDDHGYTLYTLEGKEYVGICILEYKTMIDDVKWVYVSENAISVPCDILFEIPYNNSWLSEKESVKIDEITYISYYSTEPNILNKGKVIGVVDDIKYYSVPGYDNWICCVNESDETILDLYYASTITELPVYLIKITRYYRK